MRLGLALLNVLGCTPENGFAPVSFATESPSAQVSSADFALMCPPTIPKEICPDDYEAWSVDGDCVSLLGDEEEVVVNDVLGMDGIELSDYLEGRMDFTVYYGYIEVIGERFATFEVIPKDYYSDDDFRNEINSWFQNALKLENRSYFAGSVPFDHVECSASGNGFLEDYQYSDHDGFIYPSLHSSLMAGVVSDEGIELSGASAYLRNEFSHCDGSEVEFQTVNHGNLSYNSCDVEEDVSYRYNIDTTTVPLIEEGVDALIGEASLLVETISEPSGYCVQFDVPEAYFCQGIVTFSAEVD